MKLRFIVALAALLLVGVVSSSNAQDILPRDNGIMNYHNSPDYRETESHPLRIVAYMLHPVGWALREGVFRPWSAFVAETKLTRSVFGYRDPFDYRDTFCFKDEGIPDCNTLLSYSFVDGDNEVNDVAVLGDDNQLTQVYLPDVAFSFDKSSLTALGQGRVRQIAALLAADPELVVSIQGHTDAKGSVEYNQKLGERRASRVYKELVELGIDPSRLSKESFGKSKPIFSENTDWADAVNRRVHIVVAEPKG